MIADTFSISTFTVIPIADLERKREGFIKMLKDRFPNLSVLKSYNRSLFVCWDISLAQTDIDYFAFIIAHGMSAYSNYWITICITESEITKTYIDAAKEQYPIEYAETFNDYPY